MSKSLGLAAASLIGDKLGIREPENILLGFNIMMKNQVLRSFL
jgi:hypothetical protein